MRSLPLDRQVLLGFAFAASMVVVVGVFSYLTTGRFVETSTHAVRNAEVVTLLKRVLASAYEVETAQRGFLYSDDGAYLIQRDAAITSTRSTLDGLRALAFDDPELLARVERLGPVVDSRFRLLDEVLAAHRQSGDDSRALVARGLGREEMANLSREVNAIADEQHAQLRGNAEAARLYGTQVFSVFFVALGGVVVLLLVLQYVIRSQIEARQKAHAELADAEAKQAALVRELKSANEELGNFAYVASHDLKAPLRAIGSLAQWISSDYADRLDDEGRGQMALLLGRVKRMDRLIDGILQCSRVGRVREQRSAVDLNELVAETIDLLAPPPHVKVRAGPLPTLNIERTRAQQLFQNLIGNAIQYMDKPNGEIFVDGVHEGPFWHFRVRDNGPGIEPRHWDRIFLMFQSLAPRDRTESTGIGLSLVKKIVETHGGRVWVESKIHIGSIFHFTLARSIAEAAHKESAHARDEQTDPSGRRRRDRRHDRASGVPGAEGHQSARPAG